MGIMISISYNIVVVLIITIFVVILLIIIISFISGSNGSVDTFIEVKILFILQLSLLQALLLLVTLLISQRQPSESWQFPCYNPFISQSDSTRHPIYWY